MARIKIEDLPVKEEMSEQELKGVFGGILVALRPPPRHDLRDFGFRRGRRGIGQPAALPGGVRVATADVNRVANTAVFSVQGQNDRPSF